MISEIEILRARVELLREIHTMANQALRTAYAIADRNGRDTDWPRFRETLRMSLEASHAAMASLNSELKE